MTFRSFVAALADKAFQTLIAPTTIESANAAGGGGEVAAIDGEWCAVPVWPNRERAVRDRLAEMGIGCFLPAERVRRVRRNRPSETIDRPMFPGYLFAAFRDPYERRDIRRTRFVADELVIPRNETDKLKLATQLASLQRALTVDPFVHADQCWKVGESVRVFRGQLTGVVGELIRHERTVNGNQIVSELLHVKVTLFNQSVPYPVDAADCEPW